MKMIEEMTEIELQEQLRRMETEREDFNKKVQQLQENQEEEYFKAGRRYRMLDDMRDKFAGRDGKILNLIDSAQDMLQSINKHNINISDEIKNLTLNKHREWNAREEDCYRQSMRLQEAKEEED